MTTETTKPRTLEEIVEWWRAERVNWRQSPDVEALVREAYALGAASRASLEEGRATVLDLLRDVAFAARIEATAGPCERCDPGNEGADIWGELLDRVEKLAAALRSPPAPSEERGQGDSEDEITRRLTARFRDGVEAAARILAGKGIDCRSLLDIRDPDTLTEIAETLAKTQPSAPPPEDCRCFSDRSGAVAGSVAASGCAEWVSEEATPRLTEAEERAFHEWLSNPVADHHEPYGAPASSKEGA